MSFLRNALNAFRHTELDALAQEVEHVCGLAEATIYSFPTVPNEEDLRAAVAKIRRVVPPALRRLHMLNQSTKGVTDAAVEAREVLVEAVADIDEELAQKFLEKEDITNAELVAAIRRACMRLISEIMASATRKSGKTNQ